jgi:hypothetical protein
VYSEKVLGFSQPTQWNWWLGSARGPSVPKPYRMGWLNYLIASCLSTGSGSCRVLGGGIRGMSVSPAVSSWWKKSGTQSRAPQPSESKWLTPIVSADQVFLPRSLHAKQHAEQHAEESSWWANRHFVIIQYFAVSKNAFINTGSLVP